MLINFPKKNKTIKGNVVFLLFLLCLITSISSIKISAQHPVVVTADQPNVWTLEQAHYLLAQMHRRNLDLKVKPFDKDTALDPNAINGMNVDALTTVLSLSAEFDQAIGANNKLLRGTKEYQVNRVRDLTLRRDNLVDNSLEITRKITDLKISQIKEKDDEEKKKLQNQIDELTALKNVIDAQTTQLNSEISNIKDDKTQYTSVNPTPAPSEDPSKPSVYKSLLDQSVAKIIEQFNNKPQLNASIRLENYLQMQYEILSKQLTLLRDEVGAGERLIFLEVPQSINTTYKKADNMWAQSWWQISDYAQCVVYKEGTKVVPCSKVFEKGSSQQEDFELTTSDIVEKVNSNSATELDNYRKLLTLNYENISDQLFRDFFYNSYKFKDKEFTKYLQKKITETLKTKVDELEQKRSMLNSCWINNSNDTSICMIQSNEINNIEIQLKEMLIEQLDKFITNSEEFKLEDKHWRSISGRTISLIKTIPTDDPIFRRIALREAFRIPMVVSNVQDKIPAKNNLIRVVDLFPRQSSLNVNDLKLRSNSFSFKFLYDFLWGFGGSAGYQRNREQYSQFVQQELYSSAFGKGSREFGWTFFPMPGTSRISSGARTTYAILVVPEDTTALILKSKGCYFPRNAAQPSKFGDKPEKGACFDSKEIIVPIPDGGSMNNNDFFVTGISYQNLLDNQTVTKGKRAVVTIYGRNFSSQMGVLINGVPLSQSIGLGQPYIFDDSETGKAARGKMDSGTIESQFKTTEVNGSFERMDSKQIVMSFKMDDDYVGTPTITLVSPGKAIDLNGLDIVRNPKEYSRNIKLSDSDAPYMFGKRAGNAGKTVIVEKVGVFLVNNNLKFIVTGSNLDLIRNTFLNGESKRFTPIKVACKKDVKDVKQDNKEDDKKDCNSSSLFEIETNLLSEKEKTIQVTFLTDEVAINHPPINNPAYKEPSQAQEEIPYELDETKLNIEEIKEYEKCSQKGEVITGYFQIKGKVFNQWTVIWANNKMYKPIFWKSNILRVKIENPNSEQEFEIRDRKNRLKTFDIFTFKKPTDGCKQIPN